jgi:hypothetical protein
MHASKRAGTVLLIEASTNKMCWRIINSAKSACLMISLESRFFEHYLLYDVSLMTASVLLKVRDTLRSCIRISCLCIFTGVVLTALKLVQHLLAAFRTQKIRSLELEIADHEVLTIVVRSESGAAPTTPSIPLFCVLRLYQDSQRRHVGLIKRYRVACIEEEHLAASIDRNQLPTTISADAFQLHKVLSSFQNSLDEVSLVVRPQNPQTQGNQHIRMASYNGSGVPYRPDPLCHTNWGLGPCA